MRLNRYIMLLLAPLLLSACHLDKPETPTEELYLRNFIKQFGLIDPSQDWNLAEQSEVYVLLPSNADKVVVYAEVFGEYYRVARCYDVKAGAIRIPLDVPVNTTSLAVEIDGVPFTTSLGGKVDAGASKGESRDAPDVPWLSEDSILGWVIVAEDLGSTDDVDFNDIVVRMSYDENAYYAYGEVAPDVWDVIDQQINIDDIHFTGSAPARGESRAAGETVVTIKAAAAGGVLKLWLHYTSDGTDANDWIIGPSGAKYTYEFESSAVLDPDDYEWHRWFGQNDGVMINTASGSHSYGNDVDDGETDYSSLGSIIKDPIPGAAYDFTVPADFSFATYSQLTYSDGDPLISSNFTFDRKTIQGFYITVREYDKNNIADLAYDMGNVIGHNRNQGLPPQMFLVPDLCISADPDNDNGVKQNHFRWSTERTKIDIPYSQFGSWVASGNTQWYQYGREEYVVSDEFIATIYGE